MATILVVDDEMGIRELLSEILGDEGYVVEAAENAQLAREYRQQNVPDLVLLDIWMPDTDGLSLLKEWACQNLLTMPVIMMSGHATIDTAVEATKIGALDFLEKPIALQKLLYAVKKGLEHGASSVVTGTLPQKVTTASEYLMSATTDLLSNIPQDSQSAGIPFDAPLREARDAFERAYFTYHLACEKGSMTRVAEKTGLERTHLYRKLKQLGVELSRNKNANH